HLMNQSTVVLFMKGLPNAPRCGFSQKVCDTGVEFSHFDILADESVRQGLKKMNNWPMYLQLIIKGEFVSGLDIIKEMADNGKLWELVV
ncbi:thioredoxin-like protein, partial [Lactarius quietus]